MNNKVLLVTTAHKTYGLLSKLNSSATCKHRQDIRLDYVRKIVKLQSKQILGS
jgi:hypothetical protein